MVCEPNWSKSVGIQKGPSVKCVETKMQSYKEWKEWILKYFILAKVHYTYLKCVVYILL